MQRLTDAIVRNLIKPEKGYEWHTDDQVKGFSVRVMASGQRSFVLRYHTKAGRERRMTIGEFPTWGVAAARSEASALRKRVDRGEDPLAKFEQMRDAPTVAYLCKEYEETYLTTLRPSSQADKRSQIRRDIVPALKHRKVAEVTLQDVEAIHRSVSKRGPYQGNRTRSTLVHMFKMAVAWGWRTDNPCLGITKNAEHQRARYLTGDEMPRLSKSLTELDDQQAADIFRLCLLTGARRGEVRAMRWADLDLRGSTWVKPPHATKQNKEHRVPLSPPALSVLARLREGAEEDATFVFPGEGGTGHRIDLKKPWAKVRKAAGIAEVRVHDLRHSFASLAVNAGYSLPFIGALLGHADPSTTARYSHLFDDPLREAVARIGEQVVGKPARTKKAKASAIEHGRTR
jgi:integrase